MAVMTTNGWPSAPDQRDQPPARAGCAPAIGITLVIVLAVVFVADLGISSFMCMDTQGDNTACAIGQVGGHLPLYLVGVGAISAIVYVVGRLTR